MDKSKTQSSKVFDEMVLKADIVIGSEAKISTRLLEMPAPKLKQ